MGNQDIKYDYTAELTGAGSKYDFYMKFNLSDCNLIMIRA